MTVPNSTGFSLTHLFHRWHGPHYFVATVGLVLVAVAFLYYAVLVRPFYVEPSAVHVTAFRLDLDGRACTGQTYAISYLFRVDRPTVVAIYSSVRDVAGRTLRGSESLPVYRIYAQSSETVERLSWRVPTVPTGWYSYTLAFVSVDRPTQPETFVSRIRIDAECMTRKEDRTVSPNEPGRPGLRVTPTLPTEERRQR